MPPDFSLFFSSIQLSAHFPHSHTHTHTHMHMHTSMHVCMHTHTHIHTHMLELVPCDDKVKNAIFSCIIHVCYMTFYCTSSNLCILYFSIHMYIHYITRYSVVQHSFQPYHMWLWGSSGRTCYHVWSCQTPSIMICKKSNLTGLENFMQVPVHGHVLSHVPRESM